MQIQPCSNFIGGFFLLSFLRRFTWARKMFHCKGALESKPLGLFAWINIINNLGKQTLVVLSLTKPQQISYIYDVPWIQKLKLLLSQTEIVNLRCTIKDSQHWFISGFSETLLIVHLFIWTVKEDLLKCLPLLYVVVVHFSYFRGHCAVKWNQWKMCDMVNRKIFGIFDQEESICYFNGFTVE